ncbi:Cysteine proteinase inhibitor [Thalictrum thalictroides]|uniref:Cysteine proteinase inhibitor n=1 Tax=Thalictrum thalictroides TaxID=46969 RepID=A0A7J6WFH6_THATH|nr:Cysteine proteinase inhibitor [Thalictrum thalictroides]
MVSTQSSFILLLVICFLVSTYAIAPSPSQSPSASTGLVGGYKPIDNITDPHIHDLGEFAVSEHNNKAKTSLKFVNVIKGQSQVVAGINYRLVIAAKKDGIERNYLAVVYERPGGKIKTLTSFKSL